MLFEHKPLIFCGLYSHYEPYCIIRVKFEVKLVILETMTLVQLEYIVAVDEKRHFADAAKMCFVTQPTLSMQIQ